MKPKTKFLIGTLFMFLFALACAIVAICMVMLYSEIYTYIIAGVAAFIAIPCFMVTFDSLKLSRQIFCKKCGQRLNLDTDVDYSIVSVDETKSGVYDDVDFDTCCHECGHEHSFHKKFKVASIDNNGNLHHKDIDTLIKNMFRFK